MKNTDAFLTDFVTGRQVPLIGAEENRQSAEKKLVEQKGYDKSDILVDMPIGFDVGGEPFRSRLDLAVKVSGKIYMVFKCAAGSLGSREREVLSAARIVDSPPVPYAVVSDGHTAIVLEGFSGKRIGEGWDAVPHKSEILACDPEKNHPALPDDRLEKERLIFRSYDGMNVNRAE